jgi:exopolyphosphatase/guanosine-5'-triphosphate,3'-diphosphate pyrophosphatase
MSAGLGDREADFGNGERLVGFIDIGTNSVRLLLARIYSDGSWVPFSQQKEMVRLGEGEYGGGDLQPAAMDRAVFVTAAFADIARQRWAEEIVAVATSATRDAHNQVAFLERLRKEAAIRVRVVSGREAARLVYLGFLHSVDVGNDQALFIDIGGGSTEVIVGGQMAEQQLFSLNVGAMRLSAFFAPRFRLEDPVSPEQYQELQEYVRQHAIRTVQQVRRCSFDRVFGSSGTITNLATIAARSRGGQSPEPLTLPELRRVVARLCAQRLEKRRKVPGLNPDRADMIIAGAAILHTLMEELGLSQIEPVLQGGLREGLVVDHVNRHLPGARRERSVRERSALRLGRASRFDETHARTVAALALQLFDSGAESGLHDLGQSERDLLYYAALVHDVGAFLSYSNHQLHSHYLIRNAELLGFDQREVEIVAATALFHRKAVPAAKHPEYAALDREGRRAVRLLSLFLRLAESLDRGHRGAIDSARLLPAADEAVLLELRPARDCQLELWGVRDRAKAVERTLRRPLIVRLVDSPAVGDAQTSIPLGAPRPGRLRARRSAPPARKAAG